MILEKDKNELNFESLNDSIYNDNLPTVINGKMILKDDVVIVEEKKKELPDYRIGIRTGACNICAPKYYFADTEGRRLSKSYYSIEKLNDTHYIVSDLDFMYTPGLPTYLENYGNAFLADASDNFKFHFGVVSVFDKKVTEVVPTIYNGMNLTNSNILVVYACDENIIILNETGQPEDKYIPNKLGCIMLNPKDQFYGSLIVPPVLDKLLDFDLEYEGYAHAYIGNVDGYLSKDIDVDRYESFIKLFMAIKAEAAQGGYLYSNYFRKQVEEIMRKLLYTEEEVIERIKKEKQSGIQYVKKNKNS